MEQHACFGFLLPDAEIVSQGHDGADADPVISIDLPWSFLQSPV